MDTSMTDATPTPVVTTMCTRAHASSTPTWQRFNVVHHPTASSLSASAKNTPAQQNGQNAQQQQQRHPYNKQYSHVYSRRLAELRRRCRGGGDGDDAVAVSRIIELGEGTRSTIVGTFAKTCANRPPSAATTDTSSSTSATTATTAVEAPLRLSYCDREKDSLVLEDESGRVELKLTTPGCVDERGNDVGIDMIATGVVAAVTGTVPRDGNGVMEVDRVSFPSMPRPKRFKVPKTRGGRGHEEKKADEGGGGGGDDVVVLRNALDAEGNEIPGSSPCVLLVSGLNCGSTAYDNGGTSLGLRTDMLSDFVSGNLPGMELHGARIARVIVAGGSVGPPAASPVQSSKPAKTSSALSNKRTSSAEAEAAAFPVRELDLILNSFVSSGVPVDLMPGARDPTNANWPQQPLHRCLLPNSSSGPQLLRRTPNPYEATLGEKQFLGTDGRNVSDLSRYLSSSASATPSSTEEGEGKAGQQQQRPMTELEVLEMTLRYGHVCPTAPDSLPSFPGFVDADPFVLGELPAVYFAGNCHEFATKLVVAHHPDDEDGGGRCRLICIPNFARTSTAVLVNLETLEVEPIRFED